MPELPEVEVFKQYLNSTSLKKKIEKVDVIDEKLLGKNISSRSLQMKLKGENFKSALRYGKYLFVELKRDESLLFHFGMTGNLKYYKRKEDQPEYSKVIFNFNNGYHLSFICPRKLGRVDLVENVDDFIKKNKLGPDPYREDFKWKNFKEILADRKGSIKTTLMNQKVLAGIGNVYSDEILFHSKIYPFTEIDNLDEKQLKDIYRKMNSVFNKAIKAKVDEDNFPKNYLLRKRKEGEDCPICGGTIKREKYSGRSAYYCNKHQKKN